MEINFTLKKSRALLIGNIEILEDFLTFRCLINKEVKTSGNNVESKRSMTGSNVEEKISMRTRGKNDRKKILMNKSAEVDLKKRWQDELGLKDHKSIKKKKK